MIRKSQANNMDQISTFTKKTLRYIIVFTIIIIICPSPKAQTGRFWVFFTDKDFKTQAEISEKALARRSMRGTVSGITQLDYFPQMAYTDSLEAAGYKIRAVSRWLNAASVSGSPEMPSILGRFSFVKDIKPVAIYRHQRLQRSDTNQGLNQGYFPQDYAVFDYGASFDQNHLCQIDSLHNLGFSGQGVIIGTMDTGFKLDHPTFADIVASNRIIAAYDFINNDTDVQESGVQATHGTATFSVMAGFTEGALIGTAYGANFLLAETEIQNEEIEAEEDHWIEAAEWMEAQGADIISSSLGYIDWYTPSQLDGHTCAITIAANIAASLGVIVVNSAGNERGNLWGTIIPPADGDSVIAAGGVTASGSLYSASSPGPTADGRLKPDVAAMAQGTFAANYATDGFAGFNGTSMAAPIIAGGLALVLEAHPTWNLPMIIANLKYSASNANSPNNDFGWGIAKFYNMYSGEISETAARFIVAPSPAVDSVVFRFIPPLTASAKITIFTVAGDQVNTLNVEALAEGTGLQTWNAKNFSGKKIVSGIYIALLQHRSDCQTIKFAYVN